MKSIRPFLWFNNCARDAAALYASIFATHDDVSIEDEGGFCVLKIGTLEFILFDGGPHFEFTPVVSLFVLVDNQDELDTIWNAFLDAGGTPSQCGWLTDPFGLSWQIVPTALGRLLGDPDRERAGAAHAAMMSMVKLDIAALEAAAALR